MSDHALKRNGITFCVADAVMIPTKVDTPALIKLSVSVVPVTIKLVPSKRKLLLSSSSPPVPARTTRPDVRSSTLNVFACPPALISTRPPKVDVPLTSIFAFISTLPP